MSAIALVACLIFVCALFKLDHRISPGLSRALWVPTIWFLYCATRPLNEWFATGQAMGSATSAVESGSFLDRNFLTILLVIGLVILKKRRINWPQTIKNNSWLFALFFFMLVSILWSEFPFSSLKRWVRTVGTSIIALVVLSEADPYEAMHAIIRRTMYIVIPFSMLFVKYFPLIGVAFGQWSGAPFYLGATNNKNSLGEVCAIWMFLYVWNLVEKRDKKDGPQAVRGQTKFELILVLMTLYLMKGPSGYGASGASYSATSIAVLLMGLAIFFILLQFKARLPQLGRWVVVALAGYCALMVVMNVLGISLISVVAPVLGRDSTLTGRTELFWDVLLPLACQNPVLGLGYGDFWIKPVPGLTLDSNEAHNGYLDVFLELGVVGLTLLALVAVAYFRKAKNELRDNFNWAAFRIAYLVMFLFHNWTETTLLRSREFLWNLFVLFAVVFPKEWTGHVDQIVPMEDAHPEMDAAPTASPAQTTGFFP